MNAVPRAISENVTDRCESRRFEHGQLDRCPRPDLRSVFENAPLGIAQCTPQGSVTAMNPALEQMMSRLSGGHPLCFGDLVHEDDRREGEHLLHQMFSGTCSSFRIESRIFGTDD